MKQNVNLRLLLVSLLVAATNVGAKLVIYGPQDLKAKFEYKGKFALYVSLTMD